jgi:hypothetical protein
MVQLSVPLHLQSTVGVGGAPTFTVTVDGVEPPGPSQVILYTDVAYKGPTTSEQLPEKHFGPVQAVEAVQDVAFAGFHVSVGAAPYGTLQLAGEPLQ